MGIVTCPASLHVLNRDTYRNRVEASLPKKKMVMDLRRVRYIDVSALITLAELQKQWNKKAERIFFVADTDYVESKLKAYGASDVKIRKSSVLDIV